MTEGVGKAVTSQVIKNELPSLRFATVGVMTTNGDAGRDLVNDYCVKDKIKRLILVWLSAGCIDV